MRLLSSVPTFTQETVPPGNPVEMFVPAVPLAAVFAPAIFTTLPKSVPKYTRLAVYGDTKTVLTLALLNPVIPVTIVAPAGKPVVL